MTEEVDEERLAEEPGEFLDLAEREVGLADLGTSKSLTEAEEETEHKTDFERALRAITPRFPTKRLNDLLQPIMSSRVFPDNYLDLNYLVVMCAIEEQEGNDDIDIVGIVTGVQVGTSIAYEGRHIIDIQEMFGVTREEEMAKLTKELGL